MSSLHASTLLEIFHNKKKLKKISLLSILEGNLNRFKEGELYKYFSVHINPLRKTRLYCASEKPSSPWCGPRVLSRHFLCLEMCISVFSWSSLSMCGPLMFSSWNDLFPSFTCLTPAYSPSLSSSVLPSGKPPSGLQFKSHLHVVIHFCTFF